MFKVSALLGFSALAFTLPLLPELAQLLIGVITSIVALVKWFIEKKAE